MYAKGLQICWYGAKKGGRVLRQKKASRFGMGFLAPSQIALTTIIAGAASAVKGKVKRRRVVVPNGVRWAAGAQGYWLWYYLMVRHSKKGHSEVIKGR